MKSVFCELLTGGGPPAPYNLPSIDKKIFVNRRFLFCPKVLYLRRFRAFAFLLCSNSWCVSRVIWRCNGKYSVKGKKGCESRHIDDRVLYQAFISVFNTLVENKDCFMGKWRERMESKSSLVRYKAKQFIGIIADAEVISEFDAELYFALVEKMTVYGDRLVVSLLDGTGVECGV